MSRRMRRRNILPTDKELQKMLPAKQKIYVHSFWNKPSWIKGGYTF